MNEFGKARKVMAKTFRKDKDFRNTYAANISCYLHDNNSRNLSWKECNKLAEGLLDLIFNS